MRFMSIAVSQLALRKFQRFVPSGRHTKQSIIWLKRGDLKRQLDGFFYMITVIHISLTLVLAGYLNYNDSVNEIYIYYLGSKYLRRLLTEFQSWLKFRDSMGLESESSPCPTNTQEFMK